MANTASVEIHQVNVGQGDCIIIVHRNASALATLCKANGYPASGENIDCLPYAMKEMRANSTQGKAIFAGMPTTVEKAVLIDGGDALYGADVVMMLRELGVVEDGKEDSPKLDMVVTHYHADHFAGLRDVLAQKKTITTTVTTTVPPPTKKSKTVSKKVTAPKSVIGVRHKPANIYMAKRDPKADGAGILLTEFFKYADRDARVIEIMPGGRLPASKKEFVIDLGKVGTDQVPVKLIALASSQTVNVSGKNVAIASAGKIPDQNDRSLVFVLQYGSFQYFLGGDIAGTGTAASGNAGYSMPTVTAKIKFTSHADVETTIRSALIKRLKKSASKPQINTAKHTKDGHCCVFKANHHASMSSVDVHLLSALLPNICIITSGFKEHYHRHPTKEVLGRLQMDPWSMPGTGTVANTLFTAVAPPINWKSGVYITEMADEVKGTDHPAKNILDTDLKLRQVKILGNIVIRPTDESVSASWKNKAIGTAIDIQVYGDGIQTPAGTSALSLRPTAPISVSGNYPIGPFWHACKLH